MFSKEQQNKRRKESDLRLGITTDFNAVSTLPVQGQQPKHNHRDRSMRKNSLTNSVQDKSEIASTTPELCFQRINKLLDEDVDQKFKAGEEKATELEKQIKSADSSQYDKLTTELLNTRNAQVMLLQGSQAYKKNIADNTKDYLESEDKARLLSLYKLELSIQAKIEKNLQEKMEIIKQNINNILAIRDKTKAHEANKPYEQQFKETMEKVKICKERICALKAEIKVIGQQFPAQGAEVSVENTVYEAGPSSGGQHAKQQLKEDSEKNPVNSSVSRLVRKNAIKLRKPSTSNPTQGDGHNTKQPGAGKSVAEEVSEENPFYSAVQPNAGLGAIPKKVDGQEQILKASQNDPGHKPVNRTLKPISRLANSNLFSNFKHTPIPKQAEDPKAKVKHSYTS